MLADYSYYTNDLGGTLIPKTDWTHTAEAASDWMCAATFGRLDNGIPYVYVRSVKRCCCEIAEQLYRFTAGADETDSDLTGAISHEEIGSYSITYQTPSEAISAMLYGKAAGLQDILYQIARKHLSCTGLLYRGVDD